MDGWPICDIYVIEVIEFIFFAEDINWMYYLLITYIILKGHLMLNLCLLWMARKLSFLKT